MHEQEVGLALLIALTPLGCGAPPAESPPAIATVEPSGGLASAPRRSSSSRPSPLGGDNEDIPALTWGEDLAIVERAPTVVYARADWDPASLRLEREVWSAPVVRRRLATWKGLRLDATEATPEVEHAMARLRINRIPTVVLWRDGREIERVEGPFGARELLALIP